MKDIPFFTNYIGRRVEQKLDTVSVVDSGAVKGTGKTVFTIDTGKDICKNIGFEWKLQKLMLMNPTTPKIISMIKSLPYGVPIAVDEAIFLAYKRDYQENPVKNLVKFVNICRKYRKPVFLNSPSFWDLDKDIRNLCDFRITVIKRGIACVRGKYSNPEYEDLWLREESKKIIDKSIGSDFTDLNAVIRGINKCRNHLFDIIFPDISKAEYEEYEKLSMREEGKQLFLTEKKVYLIARVLSYLILQKSYFKDPVKGFTKWNSGNLSRTANDQISRSKYSHEFSKFRLPRAILRDYKRDWKEAIEEGVGGSRVNNNNNITDRNVDTRRAAAERAVSEREQLLEEVS